MRKHILCAVVFLAASQGAQAQQWNMSAANSYYPGSYPGGMGSAPSAWGMAAPAYPGYSYPYGYPYSGWGMQAPGYSAAGPSPMYSPIRGAAGLPAVQARASVPASPARAATPGSGGTKALPKPAGQVGSADLSAGRQAGTAPATASKGLLVPGPAEHVSEPFFHFQMPPAAQPTINRVWFTPEYMLAWVRQGPLNTPLLTTGPSTNLATAGVLNQPGTTVLLGPSDLTFSHSEGVRITGGVFLDDDSRVSLEGSGFVLFPNQLKFNFQSDDTGNPVIARPFFRVDTNTEGALQNSVPGELSDISSVTATTKTFGLEANARYHWYTAGRLHASALLGVRYLNLNESLTIRDQITPLQADGFLTFRGNPVFPPSFLIDQDEFSTSNQFYGVQTGGQLSYEDRWYFVSLYGKLALGVNDQIKRINGFTTEIGPMGVQTAVGGVLALPSNIGSHTDNLFSVVPEVGINLALEPIRHVRLLLGYSSLFWSNVARPGSLIDHNVNPAEVPSSPNFNTVAGRAAPIFVSSNQMFWIQSLNLGLQLYY